MPDINDLQTHKWVLPIKGNTDLPPEQQGYLMVREITPFARPEVLGLVGDVSNSAEAMNKTEQLLVDCIVSTHNVYLTKVDGTHEQITDSARMVKLLGKRLIEKLSSFVVNPVAESELGK